MTEPDDGEYLGALSKDPLEAVENNQSNWFAVSALVKMAISSITPLKN